MIDCQRNPWELVTFLDKCAGFWPYDSWFRKSAIITYHFILIISFILPLANSAKNNIDIDFLIVLKGVLNVMIISADLTKTLVFFFCQTTRRLTYDKIFEHFNEIKDEEEIRVLHDYTRRGFRYAGYYILSCYSIIGIYSAIPLLRSFYNYFIEHGQFIVDLPVEVDYGIDQNKYLPLILLHFTMCVLSSSIVSFSFDLAFILLVHHACALIKIVTMRLDKIKAGENIESLMRKAIQLHGESYEIISLIEDGHSIVFFFLLLINTALFGGLIHIISVTATDPLECSRHVLGFGLLLIHFYVIFSQGQEIIDCTSGIFDACYDCEWYELPKSQRRMWLTIMIRSLQPCELTGGKCFILSRETYSKMLKAGMSYYTVFEQ